MKSILAALALVLPMVASASDYPSYKCTMILMQAFGPAGSLVVAPSSNVMKLETHSHTRIDQGFGYVVTTAVSDTRFPQYALVEQADPNLPSIGVIFSRNDQNGNALPKGTIGVSMGGTNEKASSRALRGKADFAQSLAITLPDGTDGQLVMTCLND